MLPTAPTLLFLHGFAESREVWTDFTRPFPAGYRLLMPNLLGHGTNRAAVADFSMEAQARYVVSYLDQKGVAGPVLVVGHSMGGYVALALAERYPDRMAGLALLNSTAYPDTDEKRQNREKNIGFVERHGLAKFMESFVRPLFAPANRDRLPEALAFLEDIAKATPEPTIAGALRGMAARPDRAVSGAAGGWQARRGRAPGRLRGPGRPTPPGCGVVPGRQRPPGLPGAARAHAPRRAGAGRGRVWGVGGGVTVF
jgi:pimeloyl-ACP methyl ester carboxylesterase